MKKKFILFSMLFAATTIGTLSNCGGSRNEHSTETRSHDEHEHGDEAMHADSDVNTEDSETQFMVDAKFQQELASVFMAYIALKDAFVLSDASKVKAEAVATKQTLGKTEMKLLSGAAHNDWMNYLGEMETSLKEMENSSDIEVQRESFSVLSDNLYMSIKAYGLDGATAYYEFCPMAFHNQGGFWLSNKGQIRNPYFGDKMLTCGEVLETLH